jgi:Protein of unknown function (DUF1592)/Protein of unknown function (DUF1588)/Protein of unknown function (DUF1595)/Protein of unknown function (DUF1585)
VKAKPQLGSGPFKQPWRPSILRGALRPSALLGTAWFTLLGCTAVISGQGNPSNGNAGPSAAPGSSSSGGGATGTGGSGATSTSSALDSPTQFNCDPSQKPELDQLRALTTLQYTNTVSDLAAWALSDETAGTTVLTEVASSLASLPSNVPIVPQNSVALAAAFPDGGWLRADQDIQFSRVQAFYNIGAQVGQALTSAARLGKVVGTCATDADTSNDASCLTSFIQSFGAHALRRPVTAADVTFYSGVYGSDTKADPAAYADVISALLSSPEFLYFVEHGETAVPNLPGVYTLSAYELASRLSYQVWDATPDAELLAAAADDSLLMPAVYQKEVDRLYADPKAKAALHRFFTDYLEVEDSGGPRGTGGLNYHKLSLRDSDPLFKAYAGADLPSDSLGQHLTDDATAMLDYYTWTAPGTIHDLLTSELSFAQAADVAQIYGVAAWDGNSSPPTFPDGQRPGLFTRALFLAAGADTSPILKGIYLRRYVLCDTIGPPPPAAANAMVPITTSQTTRQATEALTSVAPCNGCHTAWINPLGFATEDFDGLGRYRTEQTLYAADGSVATKLPIDTAVTPYVGMADDKTTASGPAELMTEIDASNKPGACLARNYFRYAFGRFEDLTADACALESIRQTLDKGGHLIDLWKAVVQTPAFKQRTFQ